MRDKLTTDTRRRGTGTLYNWNGSVNKSDDTAGKLRVQVCALRNPNLLLSLTRMLNLVDIIFVKGI